MNLTQIREDIKDISFSALRVDCDNYFEAVIVKEELKKLLLSLERFFGAPAWPSKERRLSLQAKETIKGFGGIMSGQTLYFHNEGSDTICAMLWPWQDGQHTTLKIIQKE